MKNIIIKITATLSILFFSLITSAQGPGGLPRDPSPVREPQDANIDSAIVWLIAAAVLLGAYMMLKQRKTAVK